MDTNKEAFRRYLESAGVVDALTKGAEPLTAAGTPYLTPVRLPYAALLFSPFCVAMDHDPQTDHRSAGLPV